MGRLKSFLKWALRIGLAFSTEGYYAVEFWAEVGISSMWVVVLIDNGSHLTAASTTNKERSFEREVLAMLKKALVPSDPKEVLG